jgi:predicted GH43/DUF377 family glycosyl hydrolase
MKIRVCSKAIPNIPWEERGEEDSPVWRYSGNPVIPRNIVPVANSVFNSAVVPFEDGFAGVFRCDDICRRMNIHRGFSDDGIDWKLDHEPIVFTDTEPDLPGSDYKYDPRVIEIEGRYALLHPREIYEQVGDVQNVVFPGGALCDGDTGRIAIYYGCADTCTGIAFTTVDRVIPYIQENSL